MKCTSDISPEKLNDIEVRRLSWPPQNLHFFVLLLLCPVNGWFGLVFWIIVTLEGPSASCAQFSDWWVQIVINFYEYPCAFIAYILSKTLKIHLHVSKYKLCTFPIDFVDSPPNIAFMVLTINFTFGLITSNDLLLTYFWPNDILFCGPGSVMAFLYFCASASLLWILNLSCHFLAVKPVFQLK